MKMFQPLVMKLWLVSSLGSIIFALIFLASMRFGMGSGKITAAPEEIIAIVVLGFFMFAPILWIGGAFLISQVHKRLNKPHSGQVDASGPD